MPAKKKQPVKKGAKKAKPAVKAEGVLTDKQERFCREYVIDLNGTQAAIRAGYNENTAESQASRLLTNAKVRARLSELEKPIIKKLEITKERTMLEIARLAFSDIRNFYDESGRLKNITDLDDDAAAALAGVEVYEEFVSIEGSREKIGETKKIKTYAKDKALDMLAKHFKIYDDAPKVNVNLDISNLSAQELKTLLELKRKAVK